MKNFDVVFLLLSRVDSKRFNLFLNWSEVLSDAGFHTSMATHPSELQRQYERFRIVIIDGNEEMSDFDPLQVTRTLRKWYGSNQYIVYVADNTPEAFERGRKAGADICIRGDVQGFTLCDILNRIAYGHAQTMLLGSLAPLTTIDDTDADADVGGRYSAGTESSVGGRRNELAAYRARMRDRKRTTRSHRRIHA